MRPNQKNTCHTFGLPTQAFPLLAPVVLTVEKVPVGREVEAPDDTVTAKAKASNSFMSIVPCA